MVCFDESKVGTECKIVDKKTTQYIERNVSQKFVDVCTELRNNRVPDAAILQGLTITLAKCFAQTKEIKNCDSDIVNLIDEITIIINNAIRQGVNFPSQATALAIVIQNILGIKFENME